MKRPHLIWVFSTASTSYVHMGNGPRYLQKVILTNKVMQTRTVDGMLMLIEQERHGDMVDRSIITLFSGYQIY